jgi:glycine cleavage system H protein
MTIPEHLQYTTDHEWVSITDAVATVGITAYAAEALGDVVYVGLPEVGDTVTAGASCGEIESTKSVSDLFAPVSGTVLDVNTALLDDTSIVNTDPYGAGWLFRVTIGAAPGDLLDAAAYTAQVEGGA